MEPARILFQNSRGKYAHDLWHILKGKMHPPPPKHVFMMLGKMNYNSLGQGFSRVKHDPFDVVCNLEREGSHFYAAIHMHTYGYMWP